MQLALLRKKLPAGTSPSGSKSCLRHSGPLCTWLWAKHAGRWTHPQWLVTLWLYNPELVQPHVQPPYSIEIIHMVRSQDTDPSCAFNSWIHKSLSQRAKHFTILSSFFRVVWICQIMWVIPWRIMATLKAVTVKRRSGWSLSWRLGALWHHWSLFFQGKHAFKLGSRSIKHLATNRKTKDSTNQVPSWVAWDSHAHLGSDTNIIPHASWNSKALVVDPAANKLPQFLDWSVDLTG